MDKLAWLVLALSLLLGCDAEVGSEPCTGTRCEEPPDSLVVPLMVDYTRVSAQAPLDLPIVSTTASPCNLPCNEPIRLLRAGGDAAWTLSRTGGPPTLKLLQASGASTEVRLAEPEGGATTGSLYIHGVPGGSALAHVLWSLPKGDNLDELALIKQPGELLRLPLLGARPPRGAIAAPLGYLLFDAVPQRDLRALIAPALPTGALRLVDGRGATLWQQARFPKYALAVGTSAVALADSFVVGAADGTQLGSKYGLLSVDATGKLTRFGTSADSSWYSTRLVSLGQGAYAVAAESELHGVVDAAAKGNIDVMIDRGDPNALTGFRLERFCLFELKLYGFSADDAGNLYVSSVTGERDAPRGLLCELPVVGAARCFQGPPNQLFGEIVATGEGSLFVVAGEQILRVQLPK